MNRFCSQAPVARPTKTAHSAVATTKQVGAIDLNRPSGSGEPPLPQIITQKRKRREDFHLLSANSLLSIVWGELSVGIVWKMPNDECMAKLECPIRVIRGSSVTERFS